MLFFYYILTNLNISIIFNLYILLVLIILLKPFNREYEFNLNKLDIILFKNNNFFKESFFIDLLQKKAVDNFFKKSLIIATQLFNLNFFVLIIVKYLNSFITSNFYSFNLFNDLSINSIFIKIIFMFYMFIILLVNVILFY